MRRRWEVSDSPSSNFVLRGDGFYVSYNAFEPLDLFGALPLDIPEETALVFLDEEGSDAFLVLRGDFRKEFEAVIDQGLQACMDLYYDLSSSPWST